MFRIRIFRRRKRRAQSGTIRYRTHKEAARALVTERLEYFAGRYGVTYKRVSIRNQRSRWGSCSRQGNLNFNYKVLFLGERERDYVIVHEVCHLIEFNHGENFWRLVEKEIPEYRELRTKVRKIKV